jgi:ABC-type Fe3+/spermidine/putrescine transport system ATPase subunit
MSTTINPPARTPERVTVMPENAAVAAVGLTRHYAGAPRPAVENVGFVVGQGEVLALVGPSGCGKSTTLRMIAGLEPLDGGTLHLDGVDATTTRPERRRIGWVPQSYGLFPHMNVADNVGYGLRARRTSKAEIAAAVRESLRLARVTELADRTPAQLSGGQRQRVALARALATDPRVLLLDEPLAALDPQLRDELRTELAELLRRAGRATVLVTHDQHEALALADRIAILRDGKLVQCATPEEIWANPADGFVAAFIARGAVLPGVRTDDGHVLVDDVWRLPLAALNGADSLPGSGPVEVVLRPRDLVADEEGELTLVVRQCEYLGDIVRVHGEPLGGNVRLMVELPSSSPISDKLRLSPAPGKASVRGTTR